MCVECTKDSDCRDGRKCAANGECRTDDGGSVSALPKPSTPSAPIN
jgi:Cys-rich repeat protein